MPGDLDMQGENPFFVGHHEGPVFSQERVPAISMKNPMEGIKGYIYKIYPQADANFMDRAWKEAENRGLLEHAGQPGFEDKIKELVEEMTGSIKRVTAGYISKIREAEDARKEK